MCIPEEAGPPPAPILHHPSGPDTSGDVMGAAAAGGPGEEISKLCVLGSDLITVLVHWHD